MKPAFWKQEHRELIVSKVEESDEVDVVAGVRNAAHSFSPKADSKRSRNDCKFEPPGDNSLKALKAQYVLNSASCAT